MMKKKDFVAIGGIIKESFKGHGLTIPTNIRDNLIDDLADYFSSIAPTFDRERFLICCGVEE